MSEELEVVTQEEMEMRHRSSEEKLSLQNRIAKMRLEGKTFVDIGLEVSLGERQVRRLYSEFLVSNNDVFKVKKKHIFGEIALQFRHALDLANEKLAEATANNDFQKMIYWSKIRQESLRDYFGFLKHLNLSLSWMYDNDIDILRPDKEMDDEDGLLD